MRKRGTPSSRPTTPPHDVQKRRKIHSRVRQSIAPKNQIKQEHEEWKSGTGRC